MVADSEMKENVRLRRRKNVDTPNNYDDTLKNNSFSDTLKSPDMPRHKHRISLFSSIQFKEPQGVLTGFIMLLIITNACHILESIIEHGNLIDPHVWVKVFLHKPTESPIFLIFLSFPILPLLSLGIETLLSKRVLTNNVGSILIILLLAGLFFGSAIIVLFTDCYTVTAFLATVATSVVFLKITSYHLVNYWCRCHWSLSLQKHQSSVTATDQELRSSETKRISYPDNVNLKDIYYFFLAPTMSYELNFPRDQIVRKTFLCKRILEMIVLSTVICCLLQQCIAPIVVSLLPYEETWMTCSKVLQLFKLYTSFFTAWFLTFYLIFHSSLNAFAEILRFGDRHFYGDFWNSGSMRNYWQRWNVPVHHWCTKHIFIPLINRGMSELMAATIVFTVSGIFHEYFFSFPLKVVRVRNMLSLVWQVLFIKWVDPLIPKQYANILIWTMLYTQSVAAFIAYSDYLYFSQLDGSPHWAF